MNKKKSAISIQTIEGEIWKDIPGWEDFYKVSNFGRVWSCRQNKILTPVKNGIPTKSDGQQYLSVKLCLQKQYTQKIHRLVAMTFLDNPGNLPQVNHKDSNRQNNSVANLEWVSRDENMKHAADSGRMKNNKPFRNIYKFEHIDGDVFYIIGYNQMKKHFNYKGNPWEIMPRYLNTGKYIEKGRMKGFKISSERLEDQRLSRQGVGLSNPKESTSHVDENIV